MKTRVMFLSHVFAFLLIATALFCIYVPARAQLLPGTQATITTTPSNPRPNTEVTATLDAYAYDLNGAVVRWFLDGSEVTTARNAFSFSFETGDIGTTHRVRANVTLGNGSPITVERDISPGDVDIIIEADTLVPRFYKGRALPSAGASVRAIAIPFVSGNADPDALTYEWRLGSNVLGGGARRGATSMTFTMPRANTLLSVSVRNSTGEVLTGKTIPLNPIAPQLHFYEYNPLRGLSENAIQPSYQLSDDEVSIEAMPYFTSVDPNDRHTYTWTIEGERVVNDNNNPRLITLQQTGATGAARVEFTYVNPQEIRQSVQGFFNVLFGS